MLGERRTSQTLVFGPVAVTLTDVNDYQRKILFATVPFSDTAWNLESARKNGIRPLSLAEVLPQINGETDHLVLFDTTPVMGSGNHWRVLSLDQEKRIGTLQLCGGFGTYDYRQVPPVEVPFDAVMFTGLSFERFTISGTPAKLADVVSYNQEIIKQGGSQVEAYRKLREARRQSESTYFSDATGTLKPKECFLQPTHNEV